MVSRKGDALTLINLVDDLTYVAYSTMGAAALRAATRGRYVLTRVLPIGHDWVLSGIQRLDAVAERAYETFPSELFGADDVAMLHHPVKGVSFHREHGRVEAAHRTPPARASARGVTVVRDYLADESIPPFVLSRLASAYPDTVDRLYRLALKRPKFRWATDGDALLRERKPLWYSTADLPDLTLMPRIAVEAMKRATTS